MDGKILIISEDSAVCSYISKALSRIEITDLIYVNEGNKVKSIIEENEGIIISFVCSHLVEADNGEIITLLKSHNQNMYIIMICDEQSKSPLEYSEYKVSRLIRKPYLPSQFVEVIQNYQISQAQNYSKEDFSHSNNK